MPPFRDVLSRPSSFASAAVFRRPAGVFEFDNFSKGTKAVLDAGAIPHRFRTFCSAFMHPESS
eukprot:4655172-Pleurochrysis_carterae.AAC.2